MHTSGYITQVGPWIPCLPEGETHYTFTPEQLNELLRKTYADGYEHAKSIYNRNFNTTVAKTRYNYTDT